MLDRSNDRRSDLPAGSSDQPPAADAGGERDRHAHQRDKKIDRTSWRIAIRQADMVLRKMRDQAEVAHVDTRGRRKRGFCKEAQLLGKAADAVWSALKEPPETIADAYDWDDRMEADWPWSGR